MNKLLFVPSVALVGILAGCKTELKDPQGNPVKDASGNVIVVSSSTQQRIETVSVKVRETVRKEIQILVDNGKLAESGEGEIISESRLRAMAGAGASEEDIAAFKALAAAEKTKYLNEVVYPQQIEKQTREITELISAMESKGQLRQASDTLLNVTPSGVEQVDAPVQALVDELLKKVTEELANSINTKIAKACETKIAEGKFSEARELLWRAPLGAGDNKEAVALVRKASIELIRTKVNPAHWEAIEKEIDAKVAKFVKNDKYDEAIEYLKSYRRVRTYSVKIDEKLKAVEAEIVKLGVKKDNIAPIMEATGQLVGDAARIFDMTDHTTNTVTVIEGKKIEGSTPDVDAYLKRLEEYRLLLINYDCTEEAANAIRDGIANRVAPFIGDLSRPDTWEESTTETEEFLMLGTAALNSRIDALTAAKIEELLKIKQSYIDKTYADKIKAAQEALAKTVKALVAEGKFEEAREAIWNATSTEDLVFNAQVRKVGDYLMLTLVNPTNWNAIEAEFTAKIDEATETSAYDEAMAWVNAYPDIRTYTVAIDGKLDAVKAELIKLGVAEAKITPVAEETARITVEVEYLASHYDSLAVTMGEVPEKPDLTEYDRLLEEYRQTLIRNDCTEANANMLVARFRDQIAANFYRPAEQKAQLYLGCNAVNDRLARLRASTVKALKEKKYRYIFTDLITKVTEAVGESRFQDARDIIREVPLVEDGEWDARIYATRIGLLNSLVNPNQCAMLCDEIDAKVKEFFEAKDYEGFVEYANSYEFVHDTYQRILDALEQLKVAMTGLKINDQDATEYIESLEAVIRDLLEKRTGAYAMEDNIDTTELDKALDQLYKSILEQYYRPEEVKCFCLRIRAEILALVTKTPDPMTTYEMNQILAEHLRRYLEQVPALIAERERAAEAERYAQLLADIDAEVSFDSQIAMAEDAIAHQLGIKCPDAYLKFNAVLGEYARSMRLLKLGKVLTTEQATTLLLGGVYLNQPAVVTRSIELGAEVDGVSSRDPLSRTGVLVAIEVGHNAFLKQLAELQASLGVADANGNTALHYAVRRGNFAVVKAMLEANDVNALNKAGESALFFAVRRNQTALVQALIDAKADITVKNAKGATAFDAACLAGSRDVLDALADAGALYGPAQLVIAAEKDRLAVAQWLVNNGVDVNAPGVMAATICNSDTQRYLVHEGGLRPDCEKTCCNATKVEAPAEDAEPKKVAEATGTIKFRVCEGK